MTSNSNNNNDPVNQDHQLVIAEMQKTLRRYEAAMAAPPPDPSFDDEDVIDLREYWNVLVRRKWTVMLSVLLLTIGTVIATAMITPTYKATTTIQIERDLGSVVEYKGVVAEEKQWGWSDDFYQTQYELLQSRALAGRVIDQLGLQEAATLKPDENQGYIATVVGSVKGFVKDIVKEFQSQNDSAGMDGIEDDLPPDLQTVFLKGLKVEPIRNSRLVKLSYISENPKEAALIVNTLASSFIDMTLERRFDASTYAKGFLEEQIKQVRADLEDSERTLAEYNQERGIIDQDDKLGILMKKLKEMNRAIVSVEADRIAEESAFQEMLQATDASMSQTLDNPTIQSLKARKNALQTEYQELLKIYKPAYPKMKQLDNQIAQIDADIGLEIANIRAAIQIRYQAKVREEVKLTESIANTRNQIMSLQARSTDFQTLKREVDTNRELYDGLLQRMKEVGVAAGVTNNNITVTDQAQVPRNKFSPRLGMNMAIALMLGLFGGVLLAFLFESLDDSIKTPTELESLSNKPVLGLIPLINDPEAEAYEDLSLYAFRAPASAFAEAYRSMRTSLTFSTPHGAPKVLNFCSVTMGEGKTTTALSTAINFTQTGGTVLLIDADMRNPSLHKIFGLPNDIGLSNFLSGDLNPSQIVCKNEVERLYVVPSGPVPPNPTDLLAGAKMVDLIALGSKKFDYVVIDGPPLLGLADAVVLADIAQATLMVVAANSTRKQALEAGLKRLRHSGANLLGMVLTKVEMNKAGYGYEYNYYYHYEYGASASASASAERSPFDTHDGRVKT